jgi:hypothetical protein
MSFLRRFSARSVAFAALLFAVGFSGAAPSQAADEVEVLRSDLNELVVRYTPVFKGFDSVRVDGKWMYVPKVAGAVLKNPVPGSPAELVMLADFTVPSKQGFTITSIETKGVQRFDKEIAPVGKVVSLNGTPKVHYVTKQQLPETQTDSWALAEYKGIGRTRHIAALKIAAARYDSQLAVIEIPQSVTVRITFTSKVNTSLLNGFQKLAKDFKTTLNHDETVQWRLDAQRNSVKTAQSDRRNSSVLSSGKWYKLTTETEGIYKIDAAQLAAAGITIPVSEVPTLKIFGNGGHELSEKVSDALQNQLNEQSIIVRTKQNGELDAIFFYGSAASGFDFKNGDFRHFINHYTFKNKYLLTWGGSAGKRAEEKAVPNGNSVNTPVSFTGRIFKEDEINSPFLSASGRRWFGQSIDNALPLTVTTQLPGFVNVGDVHYRFNVAHRSKFIGSMTISENNQKLLTKNLNECVGDYVDAYSSGAMDASLPGSQLQGDNRSVLKFAYSGNASGNGFLDWFEIHYPRQLIADNGQLEVFGDKAHNGITEYTVNGFSGETIGFDVTDRANPVLLKNIAPTGGMFSLKDLAESGAPKRYLMASTFKTPQIQEVVLKNLREQSFNSDVFVITHKDIIKSAEKYKAYRESAGEYSVSIITTNDIFNEYSYGAPDPAAIRDFLAQQFEKTDGKLRYVLFWGDGHNDFKGIATQRVNFVPPYESLDSDGEFDGTETYSADDFFGRIIGEDFTPDIAIGRMPVANEIDGGWLVEKILLYENNSSKDQWRSTVTLVADDGITSHGEERGWHTTQSETLANTFIPKDMQRKKIYLVEFPTDNSPVGRRKPLVTGQLLNTVNTSGSVLLNYVGHGNPRLWAHEAVFERETTIPMMTNLDKLFFLTAATCDFGRFDNAENQSGAEELILSRKGGAIGVFSASRVVFSFDNAEINENFYKQLFKFDGRIGDAYFAVKQVRNGQLENDQKFFLLGDPTLRLLIPQRSIRIETINGKPVGQDTVSLKALSTITITGSILKSDSAAAQDFQGTIVVNLFDSDINIELDEPGTNNKYFIRKTGGALNKGAFKVINGQFTATFTIPKDISFENGLGQLYAYAFSETNEFAKGATRSFKVDGIDDVTSVDAFGPEIALFLDGRTFKNGNLVRRSPLLIGDFFDETGVNTTGAGVGHNIEMWLDGNLQSENLTPLFTSSLEDPRKGSVEKQLFNLQPGYHTIRLRAWDVFNNYSEAETSFLVAESDDRMIASDVINFPNPFTQSTCFVFQHNQSSAFKADIMIFSISGQMVRELSSEIVTPHTGQICWDGLDTSGNSIAGGSYVFKVQFQSENGTVQQSTGNLILMR